VKRAKAVVEPDGNGVLLMLPDGDVKFYPGTSGAYNAVCYWSGKHPEVVIELEWRGGLIPPQVKGRAK
jgi:hypothetical protein